MYKRAGDSIKKAKNGEKSAETKALDQVKNVSKVYANKMDSIESQESNDLDKQLNLKLNDMQKEKYTPRTSPVKLQVSPRQQTNQTSPVLYGANNFDLPPRKPSMTK